MPLASCMTGGGRVDDWRDVLLEYITTASAEWREVAMADWTFVAWCVHESHGNCLL